MKRYNKILILILFLISFLMFVGCSNFSFKKITDNNENTVEKNDDRADIDVLKDKDIDTEDPEITDDDSLINDTPTPTVIQTTKNIELLIYVVNSSTYLDPVTALVSADAEITPELVVNTVVDSMADQSLSIGVESVSTQDDIVIISFYADQPPLSNVGSGLESAILDALAQSITENLDEYRKIIYRVEGGSYKSGHIELGIDEIYFED